MNRYERRRIRAKYGLCPTGLPTNDLKAIDRMFKEQPDIPAFGVDIATAGIFVVAATDAALSELATVCGLLPRTYTTRFPDGHVELWFRGRRKAGEIENGIDIITDWAIGAGSKVDGGTVVVQTDLPEADAPTWLLALPVRDVVTPRHEPEVVRANLLATVPDSDADAAWFKTNPDRSMRLRLPSAAEYKLFSDNPVFEPPLRIGETSGRAILVRQIAKGKRMRCPIALRIPPGATVEAIVSRESELLCRRMFGPNP